MRKKDVEETKSATIFLDKKPIDPGETEVGQGPTRGKGGFGLEMVNMKSGMMWWHHGDMKHGKTSML